MFHKEKNCRIFRRSNEKVSRIQTLRKNRLEVLEIVLQALVCVHQRIIILGIEIPALPN